jgi:lysophospholipase L1-like esterase
MPTGSLLDSKINTSIFYNEWKGHPILNLQQFRDRAHALRPGKPIIYLAGDSSLDNKAWVSSSEPLPPAIPDIYEHTLTTTSSPGPKHDVAFWVNHIVGNTATCINAAVEESMLRERDVELLAHDAFIRDSITSNDVLVVSIGANDIALRPSKQTIWHMADLAWMTRRCCIEDGSAASLGYFRELFGTKIQNYISRITTKQKPRAVIVCMIYHPLEATAGQKGWADMQLKALGYNSWPGQLQAAIKQIYESATKSVKIEGTRVLPCPLFEVLDGKNAEEYVARVEPSSEGGKKMAQKFADMLKDVLETA